MYTTLATKHTDNGNSTIIWLYNSLKHLLKDYWTDKPFPKLFLSTRLSNGKPYQWYCDIIGNKVKTNFFSVYFSVYIFRALASLRRPKSCSASKNVNLTFVRTVSEKCKHLIVDECPPVNVWNGSTVSRLICRISIFPLLVRKKKKVFFLNCHSYATVYNDHPFQVLKLQVKLKKLKLTKV